jgi:NADPH:quinone reductase-like Zn-dependent oxidoreductase
LKAGDTVAVAGAAGGVGTIAVQLARHEGATVIGIAGPSNDEWLTAHGVIPVNTIIDFPAAARFGVQTAGNADASNAEALAELAAAVASGELEVPIAYVFSLDDVRDAYRTLEQRHTRGKIVLRP